MLKVSQVAKMLNLSVKSVYQLLNNGELIFYKLGSAKRIKQSDLNDYLERSKQGTPPQKENSLYPTQKE